MATQNKGGQVAQPHPAEKKQSMYGGFVKGKHGEDDMSYKTGYSAGMKKAAEGEGYKEGMHKAGYSAGYKEGMTKALEKSDVTDSITEDELVKSLETLEQAGHTQPLTRKDELLYKSENGGLSDVESVEFVDLLQGGGGLPGEIAKSMQPSDDLEKSSIQVNDFLRETYTGSTDALGKIGDRLEKAQSHQQDYNAALADGVVTLGRKVIEQGELMKSMADTIETMSGQPARPPKSKQSPAHRPAEVMAKSMGAPQVQGGPEGQDNLNKGQVLDIMEEMMMKSDKNEYGPGGGFSKCGEPIHESIAAYEGENCISKGMAGEVIAFRQGQMN